MLYIEEQQPREAVSGRQHGGEGALRFDIVVAWALAGLMAGGLAGALIKPGGYGLLTDLLLGLAGSLVGTVVFQALGTSPEAGWLVMPIVQFSGAASMILGQRWWYTHA